MRDRVRLTALANVVLFLAAVVGLATIDDDDVGSVLAAAAEATARSGTAAFSIELTFGTEGGPMRARGTGRIDFDRKRFLLTIEGFNASDTINDNSIVYVRNNSPGRKPWLAYDRRAEGSPLPLGGLGADDPLQSLETLRRDGVARNVRVDGTEEVRATPTTRWMADLDPAKLAGVSHRNRQFLEAAGIRNIAYSLWVSDDGIVRRFRVLTEATAMSAAVTIELYDFGVAPQIDVPPADQVERIDLDRPRR